MPMTLQRENQEQQSVDASTATQTIVLAPLILIDVNFKDRSVKVTQNDEPLATAQLPAGSNRLLLEVRPVCSVPVPGRDPKGVG